MHSSSSALSFNFSKDERLLARPIVLLGIPSNNKQPVVSFQLPDELSGNCCYIESLLDNFVMQPRKPLYLAHIFKFLLFQHLRKKKIQFSSEASLVSELLSVIHCAADTLTSHSR